MFIHHTNLPISPQCPATIGVKENEGRRMDAPRLCVQCGMWLGDYFTGSFSTVMAFHTPAAIAAPNSGATMKSHSC